jgi:hypothetical protein
MVSLPLSMRAWRRAAASSMRSFGSPLDGLGHAAEASTSSMCAQAFSHQGCVSAST